MCVTVRDVIFSVRHPPVLRGALRPKQYASLYIHYQVAEPKEGFGWQRLGKEVREVVRAVHELYTYDVLFHQLTHIEVASVYVLCAVVELGVVGKIDCGHVVYKH